MLYLGNKIMFDFLHIVALLSPIIPLGMAVYAAVKCNEIYHRKISIIIIFGVGFIVTGILFYIIGIYLGWYFACREAKTSLCVLGGAILVGPFAFTFGTSSYTYFWIQKCRTQRQEIK